MSWCPGATSEAQKPGVLVHICCGPCATYVVRALREDFHPTGYFYNPNIHPEGEYTLRREALEAYAVDAGLPLREGAYDVGRWLERVAGHQDDPEGGERCAICFRVRLEETARHAKAHGFEHFATTLTVSPHKNAEGINRIGEEVGAELGLCFHKADFKKHDGFKNSCRLSRQLGMYRQHYCGCVYSARREST